MIEVIIDSIRVSLMSQYRIVILKDTNSDRYLPIWIGPCEADAITIELQEMPPQRPLTHDLLKSMIRELGGKVDTIKALIPFTYSDAIRQDKGINRIRAVCIGDYLALYVNDTFVAETHDDYFDKGYTGLSVAVVKGGDADITFDDLTVYTASRLP